MHVFDRMRSIHFGRGQPCRRSKVKAKSKAELNSTEKGGRDSTPPERRRSLLGVSGAGGCCNEQAADSPPAQSRRSGVEGAREQRRSDTDAARRRWRSSRPLQRRQSAMPLRVRLRSRRQTTGLQSSTRLLKRPGERPRVAKPQPSEQGLPPQRWRLLQRKQPTSPPSTKPPQRSQKARRSNVVLTQMRQGRRWRSSRPTTDANAEVAAIHPKAMPVILGTDDEIETWMTAPAEEALKLQRPFPNGALRVVMTGEKEDKA